MHGITAEFWLLNELHETGSFKDGAVSQLVEVAGKNDRRRRVIAKQLVNTRLDVIEQRVGLVEWTR